ASLLVVDFISHPPDLYVTPQPASRILLDQHESQSKEKDKKSNIHRHHFRRRRIRFEQHSFLPWNLII
ncbi:MAG: hypothetical protein K2P57_07180, partial [Burkholderiales bacterium]|nr:hypothetical protein [Burkholderiales bacterium]